MDNQKDIKKTGLTSYGQANVHDSNTLISKPIYEFVSKKTEKLVTALYMVTDCMETEDAMKAKLRLLGVELLSDMYKLSISPAIEKSTLISISMARVYEIISFTEIAYTIGYISEMNSLILKKEFNLLLGDLKAHESKDKHFTFTLDEKMFDLSEQAGDNETFLNKNTTGESSFIKDIAIDKRTINKSVSFIPRPQNSLLEKSQIKKNPELNVLEKQDRTEKILTLIKDKNASQKNSGISVLSGVSIKDISFAFTNCSEKTIQRELNSLVSKNKLKKTGAKRWSKYQIA